MRAARRCALVLAMLTASPALAAAQSKPTPAALAEARELYQAGVSAYQQNKFAMSVQALDQAYGLVPRVEFRFNAAKALMLQYAQDDDLALLDKAKGYFEQYLSERPDGKGRLEAITGVKEIKMVLAAQPRPAVVVEGDAPPVAVAAAPAPPPATTGWLSVTSAAKTATVSIDGSASAPVPFSEELAPGRHTVTVTAAGYRPFETEVDVSLARVTTVPALLEEIPAELSIQADGGADVVLDGRLVGEAPMSQMTLPSGAHRIAVGRNGYHVFTERFEVDRAEARTIDVDLEMTGQRVTSWVVIGVGGAVTVVAIAVAALAAQRQNQAMKLDRLTVGDGARALTPDERDDYNNFLETRDSLRIAAAAGFGISAISAGVGLLLFSLDEPQLYGAVPSDDPKAVDDHKNDDAVLELTGAAVVPIDGGAALSVSVRF